MTLTPSVEDAAAPPPPGRGRLPGWLTELGRPGARGTLARQALIDSAGNGIALGLLTLFLVGPAGLTKAEVAGCLTLAAAGGLLATLPARRLMPRIGARRYAIGSNLIRAVLIGVLPFTSGVVPIGALLILNGVAEAGRYAMYQVIIAEAVPDEARTEVMGIRRALGNLGFTAAAGLSAVAIAGGGRSAFQAAFLFDVLTFLVSAALVARIEAGLPGTAPPAATTRHGALGDVRYMTLTGLRSVCGIVASGVLTVGLPLWVVTETEAPRWIAGLLLGVNTLLVVLFQVAISARVTNLAAARRALLVSCALTCVGMAGFALASHVGAGTAALLLCAGTALVGFGEMADTASWWVISFDLAPVDRRAEYLTTFDMSTPATEIAGPTAMVLVVAAGSTGWVAFGALVLASGLFSALLLRHETAPGKDTASA